MTATAGEEEWMPGLDLGEPFRYARFIDGAVTCRAGAKSL